MRFPARLPRQDQCRDPQVDTDTRNVKVRATLKNPEHELLPGMFTNVSVEVGAPVRYLTLPQTAVAYNPYGATVYVVVAQSKGGGQRGAAEERTRGGAARSSDASGSAAFGSSSPSRPS